MDSYDPQTGSKVAFESLESTKSAGSTNHEPLSSDSLFATDMSQLSISSDLAKRLLKNGFLPDVCGNVDKTEALVWAIERNQIEIVQELISQGADVNLPTEHGLTCLHIAAGSFVPEILQVLLKNGADVSSTNGRRSERTALHYAASAGDSQAVEILISHGSNVDAQTSGENCPLHMATDIGDLETIRALLNAGANIQCVDNEGWSPLHIACSEGDKDTVQLLVERGANMGLKCKQDRTPLHIAAHTGQHMIVKQLLAYGADINTTATEIGTDVLSFAVSANSVDTAQTLLDHGASIESGDIDGTTPLMVAVRHNAIEMASFLLDHNANIEASNKTGDRPLHLAIEMNFGQMMQLLIEKGADIEARRDRIDEDNPEGAEGLTPLLVAARFGRLEAFHTLVDHGANTKVSSAGCNGLHLATAGKNKSLIRFFVQQGLAIDAQDMNEGNTALIKAVQCRCPQTVSFLIKLGADVNVSNNAGWTPLHFAAKEGFKDVIEILLKGGANPTAKTLDGKRPRTIAWEQRHHEATTMLDGSVPISLDARNEVNVRRLSSLFHAAAKGHLNKICQILDDGIEVDSLDADGRSPLSLATEHGWSDIVHTLTGRNADPGLQDNYGGSPLWWASRYGQARIVEHLLDKGAQFDEPDADGQSPLSVSSQYGHLETAKTLLQHGANPNSSTDYGKTPLLFSVDNKQLDAVKLLLEYGADINYKSPQGVSALSLASQHGLKDIVDTLKAHPNLIENDSGDRGGSESAASSPTIPMQVISDVCLRRHSMLVDAAEKGRIAMIKRLIKAGADPNPPFGCENPLYEAASRGQHDAVSVLADHGAVVDPDAGYYSPLVIAAFYGFTDTVKLLHSLGASIEAAREPGETALLAAAQNGHEATVSLLLQLGAKTEVKGKYGRVPLWYATENRHVNVVKLLVKYGANIEAADHYGLTPLMVAVRFGDRKLTEYFLEVGSQMRPDSRTNYSPLCRAAANGDEAIVDLLLDHGADLDYLSDGKRTALHIATIRRSPMVVKMLIEAGANVDLKDGSGRTALSIAKESSNDATMRLLCRSSSLRRDNHRQRRKVDKEDSNKRDSYQYHPLMMMDSIRIIELYPGTPGDIIEFELEDVSLSSKPRFEALSYEWQEKCGTIPVQCDGQKTLITPNCKAAMERLRLRDKSRYLWIDAICINQTDDQERNQQVALMGEIYRAAHSVIMWLGEETPAIKIAFDLLPRVARAQRTLLKKAGELLVDEVLAEGGEDPKTLLERMFEEQNVMKAFDDLTQRTYWTRAWILPEIVIAGPRGIVMCGNLSCEWMTLKYGMPLYRFCSYGQPPMIFNTGLVGDLGPQAEILFQDVVFILHTLEATDPRDKVFASLGLVTKMFVTVGKTMVEFPVADYIMSVQQVFVHATRYMIEVCGIDQAWGLGMQRSTKKIDNLPSWVPDFNRRPARAEINPFREIKSSFRLDINEDTISTEASLQISGCIVDKVVFTLTLTRDLEISAILSLAVDALAKTNRSIYGTYPIGEGFDVDSNFQHSEEEKGDESSLMKSTNAMAFFATITHFANKMDEEDNRMTPDRVFPVLTGYLIWILSMNMNTPGLSKTAPEHAERFAEKWADESGDSEALIDFELDNLKLVEDVLRVDKDLIYTENGHFGLANPGEAEVGMVLAMVGRSYTLRLLRKKDDATSFYEYVDMVFLNTMGQQVDKVERMFRDVTPERLEIR